VLAGFAGCAPPTSPSVLSERARPWGCATRLVTPERVRLGEVVVVRGVTSWRALSADQSTASTRWGECVAQWIAHPSRWAASRGENCSSNSNSTLRVATSPPFRTASGVTTRDAPAAGRARNWGGRKRGARAVSEPGRWGISARGILDRDVPGTKQPLRPVRWLHGALAPRCGKCALRLASRAGWRRGQRCLAPGWWGSPWWRPSCSARPCWSA